MRRGQIIALLLLASHAGVWWAAKAIPAAASGDVGKPVKSSDELQQKQATARALDQLLAADRARQKAEDEAEPEVSIEEKVAAAVAKWQGDPAELLAKEDGSDVGIEDRAAFQIWLGKDPMAALHWLAGRCQDHSMWEMQDSLEAHLAGPGRGKLESYLNAAPGARGSLLEAAAYVADRHGLDLVLDLAGGLSRSTDRYEMLRLAFRTEEHFTGHLAAIFALLDPQEQAEFLHHFQERDEEGHLSTEIHAAGLPPVLLGRYEHGLEDVKEESAKSEEEEKQEESVVMSSSGWLRELVAESGRRSREHNGFLQRLPEFDDWRAEVADGRLSPDEFLARVKTAVPECAAMEKELRLLLLKDFLPDNPPAAFAWLRESGGDWRSELAMVCKLGDFFETAPETLANVIHEAYGSDTVPEEVAAEVHDAYDYWRDEDLEGCTQAIRSMPDGAVKDLLVRMLEEAPEER